MGKKNGFSEMMSSYRVGPLKESKRTIMKEENVDCYKNDPVTEREMTNTIEHASAIVQADKDKE